MEQLNEFPIDWKETILGDCVTSMKSGLSRLLSESDIGIPMLRSCNIGTKYPVFKPLKYWYKDDPQGAKTSSYVLKDGDILVNFINSISQIGKACLFRNEIGRECIYTTNILRLAPNKKALGEFLFLITQTDRYNWYVSTITKPAVNQASFTTKDFKKYSFTLPPLPEQKAITDLLSTWDEAIEKIERLVQAKEKRFKWLINFLINATKSCEKSRLGKICTVTKGKQLNITHMKDDGIYYALNGGIEPSGRTADWNTEAETVTISEGGNSCGYVNYNTERFWSGGHCYSLLNLKETVEKQYLYFYLKMNEPKLMKLRVGSGLPNIQKKDVDKFLVALPSLDEQQQTTQSLSLAQHEINLLKQLSDKYKTQKRGLMQKMLTGEWRVKPEIVNQYMEA